MAIYRGAGGAGDAVGDASSEVLLALQAKDAAQAAQAAAELAQIAAETAETNAETAETNAETAETNAETAETNAETAATNAASSASAASTSATNAAASASTATTQATNAASSASAASTSASNASTSATNASNSASSASTSATNASNSASAASTSATNAANSATAAQTAQTAAELAETNAETAETNAETAETNAAASASAASASASNAASSASSASTSASNASSSASSASTSATNAANSASTASTQATNASNSASAASTSATNAASSATAAAASYDSFDDRYLGSKSSAPTLDNDGNALLTGALYFNTVDNAMKVYNGSAWLDAYASLSGALLATNNLSDLTNTGTARTNLGVAIGTNVQAYDAQLADIAGLTPTDNNFIVGNGTNFVTESGSTARTSLGLGSIATQDASNVAVTGGSINGTTIGATTATTGKFTAITNSALTSGRVTYAGASGLLSDSADFVWDNSNTRLGIGINSPVASIDVLGYYLNGGSSRTNTNTKTFGFRVPHCFTATNPMNVIGGLSTTSVNNVYIGGSDSNIGGTAATNLLFYTAANNTTADGTLRMSIDSSGNVGIGTSSPVSQLTLARTSDLVFTQNGYGVAWGGDNGSPRIYGVSSGTLSFKSGGGSVAAEIDSSNNFRFNSGYGSSATAYGCRAWVNFNGTGTVAINGSGNVSSITDNGTGQYTVNFTTSLTDTNYSVNITTDSITGDQNRPVVGVRTGAATSNTTVRTVGTFNNNTDVDCSVVCVAVHR